MKRNNMDTINSIRKHGFRRLFELAIYLIPIKRLAAIAIGLETVTVPSVHSVKLQGKLVNVYTTSSNM